MRLRDAGLIFLLALTALEFLLGALPLAPAPEPEPVAVVEPVTSAAVEEE